MVSFWARWRVRAQEADVGRGGSRKVRELRCMVPVNLFTPPPEILN